MVVCAAAVYKSGIAPLVSASCLTDLNDRTDIISSDCYVGIQFNTDGEEYQSDLNGSYATTTVGTWLDQGTSSQVWVEFLRTGGTQAAWDNKSNSTRYNIASSVDFYIRDTNINDVAETIIGSFRFHDAATGGNILQTTTASQTWSANIRNAPCKTCCFTPWTLITMADGSRMPIVDVRPGDLIRVVDGVEPVAGVTTRENRAMYLVKFDDGRVLEVSDDHPLYVEGKGYAAINPEVEYKDLGTVESLKTGDKVLDERDNLNVIVSMTEIHYPQTVYTFTNSKFYANGMLVY